MPIITISTQVLVIPVGMSHYLGQLASLESEQVFDWVCAGAAPFHVPV